MFENLTQEYFMDKALEQAGKMNVSTVEGSLTYNAAAMMAVMLEDAFDNAEEIYLNAFPDTCDREHLIRFCRDKGLKPESATKAVWLAKANCNLAVGTVLLSNDRSFTVTAQKGQDESGYLVEITCEEAGTDGNTPPGFLDTEQVVDDFEKCEVIELLTPGEDDEDTEHLRERYFGTFSLPGQFGNERYYEELILSVPGISAARVYVLDSDRNNIILQVVGENGAPVTQQTLDKAVKFMGGFVAVGRSLSVIAAVEVPVNLTMTVKVSESDTREDAQAEIEKAVDAYCKQLNLGFRNDKGLSLRLTAIESLIYALGTVEDCEVLTINGAHQNLTLDEGQIFTKGEITVDVS